MKPKQLSIFEDELENNCDRSLIKQIFNLYGANICFKCLCNTCVYSVEQTCNLTDEEMHMIGTKPCWNCDECWYYGMDNGLLRKDIVRFQCSKYKMTKDYVERYAKGKRRNFKIIKEEK